MISWNSNLRLEEDVLKAIELFAGAGGLAMGVSMAGFKTAALVEMDAWACETILENKRRCHPLVHGWPVHRKDVRAFNWESLEGKIDLVSGGPPCQPFSLGGKHGAYGDERDMFPVTVDVIRRIKPRAFIVENVKGLTRKRFANYYQYILLSLEFPEARIRGGEDWLGHFRRLQEMKTARGQHCDQLAYNVVPTLVNAADYGVPQKRERVFIVGFRSDLGIEWSFPRPTHSLDALIYSKWVSGDYWRRHRIGRQRRPAPPEALRGKIRRFTEGEIPPGRPWRTVRDALRGLPDPRSKRASRIPNHVFQGGARVYDGHTGSPLDLPAKTLKAGAHGVPGGENMMVYPDGSVRYFTVRESARLQTFPDGYVFHGSWTETMRQLGNAVPVVLARVVAESVAERLIEARMEEAAPAVAGCGVA